MKIVYIVKYIAQLGGLDRVMTDKMNYLSDKLNHEIFLITYEQGKHPFSYSLSSNINHIDLNVRFFTRYKYKLLKRTYLYLKMRKKFKQKLYKQIQKISPDILICSTDSYSLLDILMNTPGNFKKIVESHVERNSILKKNDFKNHLQV